MTLWIILGMGWLVILSAAVALQRIAGYADKKMRRLTGRSRRREGQAA